MSNKIKYALGGKPIDFVTSRSTLEIALYARECDLDLEIQPHHVTWFIRVWLNYQMNLHVNNPDRWVDDLRVVCPKTTRWHKTGEVRFRPQLDSMLVTYLLRWLVATYPEKRDLTMISYEQATAGASAMFAHCLNGQIVYTDSRLVTTFVPEGQDPDLPENWYEIRRVHSKNLVQYVGNELKNCLRSDQRSYYSDHYDDAASHSRRLYIVVAKGTTRVMAAFHRTNGYTDPSSGVYYARMTSPLAYDNKSLGFFLPCVVDHDGWRMVTDPDAYEQVADRIRARQLYIKEKLRLREFVAKRSILDDAEAQRMSMTEEQRRRHFIRGEISVLDELVTRGWLIRWPTHTQAASLLNTILTIPEGSRRDAVRGLETWTPGGALQAQGRLHRYLATDRVLTVMDSYPGFGAQGLGGQTSRFSNRNSRSYRSLTIGSPQPYYMVMKDTNEEPTLGKAQHQLEREDNYFNRQPPKKAKKASNLLGRILGLNQTNL